MTNLETMLNEENSGRRRLVTAALPYINNVPHLGHIAGSHLPADIFARYCRSKGFNTLFIGATDEHGSASEIAASQVGVDLKTFSDKLHEEHKKVYDWFGISYDHFSRTSNKTHKQVVTSFFKKLNEKGFIKEGSMPVFYSPNDDMFLPDRYVIGECPKCEYKSATGDQCESCTSLLDSHELKNPKSTLTGEKLEIRESEHLFLALDQLSPEIEQWIKKQTHWRPQVKNLAMGWIKEGLKERCITRDLKNGIPVPLKGYEDKVFYVWFDAPMGYISATKEATNEWESFWTGDSQIYNFLGKDNIPFHTIFWPGMIIGSEQFNLPTNVIGLQYLNYEGKKFSKSKQIGVFCETLPKLGLSADIWRAYLTQVIPESNDSEFKWEDFIERTNSDLIDNFGNFVNRIVKFTSDRLEGKIERPDENRLKDLDKSTLNEIEEYKERIEGYLERSEMRKAYSEVLALSSLGNKYINDSAPWVTLKEDMQRTNDIIYIGARLLKALTTYIAPFIPENSEKVWSQLGLKGSPLDANAWDNSLSDFEGIHKVGNPEILFKKLEKGDEGHYREEASKGTDLEGFFN